MVTTGPYDSAKIVLAVDCSGSMNGAADPGCTGGLCPTKITAARKALIDFVNAIDSLPNTDKHRYFLNIEVFKQTAVFVVNGSNDYNFLTNFVADNFTNNVYSSPACNTVANNQPQFNPCESGVCGQTNLGHPTEIANDYFKSQGPNVKKIYILITDGLPNTSYKTISDPCNVETCSGPEAGNCSLTHSINYLRCTLSGENDYWEIGQTGNRPEDVDAYTVSVMGAPLDTDPTYASYTATQRILNNSNGDGILYTKRNYNLDNGNELTNVLLDIFNDITTSEKRYNFKRITPTPIF